MVVLAGNGLKMATNSRVCIRSNQVVETKAFMSNLCRQFYDLGTLSLYLHGFSCLFGGVWTGLQKERMVREDMYVVPSNGSKLSWPISKPYPLKPPKSSDFAPLCVKVYSTCGISFVKTVFSIFSSCLCCGCVLQLGVDFYCGGVQLSRSSKEDMDDIEHRHRSFLFSANNLLALICCAMLYVHGAECYHYVFDAAINLHPLGLDCSTRNHGPIPKSRGVFGGHQNVDMSVKAGSLISHNDKEQQRRCIVLDIEGTTTPISFVTDILFPYARENVGRHLDLTYDSTETQDDIKLLRSQVHDDLQQGIAGAVPIPSNDAGKQELIAALSANVQAMIRADRKITALKQLQVRTMKLVLKMHSLNLAADILRIQGHIWRTGFQNNEIEGVVFDDVPEALENWHALGIKVYIYSSGSRLAQRLIFGNTNYGDLRKYLCGFFDTRVGNKKETSSYVEISESLGVDKPSEILFVTDVYQEAIAAKAAGLEVIISVRPGNGPLPENHGFKTIQYFSEI
ncbi:hypothetical protein RHSIM_Rhsim06G0199700 [Rhododendron simsii]|uniref:Enolase-phosphatase E1 n=1 Tax=Rhododendron simsii TaxID=118357 RepID=A0A834GSE9_RHOSS|nr:hypothetical protein RHSIM_Rhsim06G0199700 [Rhododendron simsii]